MTAQRETQNEPRFMFLRTSSSQQSSSSRICEFVDTRMSNQRHHELSTLLINRAEGKKKLC